MIVLAFLSGAITALAGVGIFFLVRNYRFERKVLTMTPDERKTAYRQVYGPR